MRGVGATAFGAGIVNNVVGAGIFSVPAALALNMGAAAPLAFLACAVAMAAVVICCAEGGSRVPTSGGMYGYIEAGLGPQAGFVAAFIGIWLSSALAAGGIAAAFADALAVAVPAMGGAWLHAALIVVAIGGLNAANLLGAAGMARFISVATFVKLIPLLLFVGVGVWFASPDNLHSGEMLHGDGFGRAVILALFTFTGMETVLSASGEVANPSRNIPRALFGAMLFVLFLYIAIQVIAEGLLGPALGHSAAPLADAIAVASPALRPLLLGATALSMLVWLASDAFGAPRVLFAFGRDGLLPAVLGRVNARGVPDVAIACHAATAIAFGVTGSFVTLAVLAALASTILYALACISAWRLQRRDVATAGPPVRFRILPAAAIVGVASMAAILALGQPAEIVGTLGATIGAALLYQIAHALRRKRSKSG